jgi:hypothetical protein
VMKTKAKFGDVEFGYPVSASLAGFTIWLPYYAAMDLVNTNPPGDCRESPERPIHVF